MVVTVVLLNGWDERLVRLARKGVEYPLSDSAEEKYLELPASETETALQTMNEAYMGPGS
jgi:hypothetical protein